VKEVENKIKEQRKDTLRWHNNGMEGEKHLRLEEGHCGS
jgi:hypothetical protein